MSTFNKSRIRLASLSPPNKNFNRRCMDWGACGLVALAGKGTVFLYRANLSEITFLRSIEIITNNISAVKFHDELPYLAIAEEMGRILLWDCETAATIGISRSLGDSKFISDMKWANKILIGFSAPGSIFAFDFWPFESDQGATSCRILWHVDLMGQYSNITVDARNGLIITLFNNSVNFSLVYSKDAKTRPTKPVASQSLAAGNEIQDIVFHPHVQNFLLIALQNEVFAYNILTKSLRSVFRDESNSSPFEILMPSLSNDNEIAVLSADSSLSIYTANLNYSFVKSGIVKLKREQMTTKVLPIAASCNQSFAGAYTVFSPINGLCLVKVKPQTGVPILCTQNFTAPLPTTCFDFCESTVAFGTTTGEIYFANVTTGEYTKRFFVSKESVSGLRFMDKNKLLWYTKGESGSINLQEHAVRKFLSRTGPASGIVTSEELGIFLRGRYALGIVSGINEKPLTLSTPIIAVTAQIARTPATCFGGDSPNFAVLLKTGYIHIYTFRNGNTLTPVLKLRCSREDSKPTAVAWKGDCIVTADSTGALMFYDFAFGTSRMTTSPFVDIDRIEFERGASGLYLHSKEGKFGFCLNSVESCSFKVQDFVVTGNGLVLVQSSDDSVKFIISRDWRTVKKISMNDILKPLLSSTERLKVISDKLLERSTSGTSEEAEIAANLSSEMGFPIDSTVWRCVARSLGGKPLPVKLSIFGNSEEISALNVLEATLYSPEESNFASLYSLLLCLRLNDWAGAEHVLSCIAKKPEFTVIATIAGALLSNAQKGVGQEARDLLITTAVPLFANHRYIEGCILLHLAGANITAAKYLQENGKWEDAVSVAKLYDDDKEESVRIIKRAAHHFLDSGNQMYALLLFISLKEYHPALAILSMMKMKALAFHLMMFLDRADAIRPYTEDTSRYAVQFPDLDTLRSTIIVKYEKLTK